MIILLSPAKIVNLKPQKLLKQHTLPEFTERSTLLMHELRKLTPDGIANLMKINKDIAYLNYQRYINWHLPFTTENAKQAMLMFNGEVYHGLAATTFGDEDFMFAQDHLRILSGLYGILRPWDLVQPYRLEMGIKLATAEAPDLYKFWGSSLTDKLNDAFQKMKNPVLIHLASHEYAKAVQMKNLKARVIQIEFWEQKDNHYKTIVVYTKKARGMLSRFIIQHKLTDPQDLQGFDEEGYIFNPHYSRENHWVFTRR